MVVEADEHVTIAPAFVPSWAEGDLVIGGTLLDVRTTLHLRPLRPEWIYQLLAYALLDATDAYGIQRAGIYLTRQSLSISWPLDDMLNALCVPARTITELLEDFAVGVDGILAEAQLLHEFKYGEASAATGTPGSAWRGSAPITNEHGFGPADPLGMHESAAAAQTLRPREL